MMTVLKHLALQKQEKQILILIVKYLPEQHGGDALVKF